MSRTFTQHLSAELNPDSQGMIFLVTEFDIHPDLSSLTVDFPDYVTPKRMTGFSKSAQHQCSWDGHHKSPKIRFHLEVDRTNGAGYEFVDTGTWAVFRFPPFSCSWRYSGRNINLAQNYDLGDNGIVSSDGSIVYLGSYDETRFEAGGQTFRLAIPAESSLRASRRTVTDSLTSAATQLKIGGRNDEVVIVAVPSSVNWGWGGLQSGTNGYWALDTSQVESPNNTWIHEYVHTRQEWQRDSSTQWLIEGTTEFYAALLTYQAGNIPFSAFHDHVVTDRDSESVLVDPSQWTSGKAHYTKGRRVVAALDAEIRRRTDGGATFEDVFRRMNELDRLLTHERFTDLLGEVVDDGFENWATSYIESTQTPDIPHDEDLFLIDGESRSEPETGPEEIEVEDEGEEPEGESEREKTTECPICGATVGVDDQYCSTCGTSLFKQCSVCGREVTDEPYCPECGTTLQEECDVCGYRRHPSEEFCSNCGIKF